MKQRNTYPRYLDALLTKHLTPDTSKAYQDATRYLDQVNKTINKRNSKVSPIKK